MIHQLKAPWKLSTKIYGNGQLNIQVLNKNNSVVCLLKTGAGDKRKVGAAISKMPDMINLLEYAVQYLSHPDVKSIPFVIRSEKIASDIQKLLKEIEAQNDLSGN